MIVVKFILNLVISAANLGGLLAFLFFFPVFKETIGKADPVFFWAMVTLVFVAVICGAAVMTFSGKQ